MRSMVEGRGQPREVLPVLIRPRCAAVPLP